MGYKLSRRGLLGGGAGVVIGALAGCAGGSDPPGTGSPSGASVFQALSFDGPDLVVELVDEHAVSRVNLIGPDGSLFGSADVAAGARTVRIELLDIKPEGAGMKHYTPGEHELFAVGEEESASMKVDLVPDLEIVDVRQYREGDGDQVYGRLVVEVENVGSGPTWVYDVTNRNAPNRASNANLGSDPGVLLLEQEGLPESAIITPEESKAFEDVIYPLVFPDSEESRCDLQFDMTVIVGTPIIDPIEETIRVTTGGESYTAGLTGGYTCSVVSVESS